MYGLKNISIEAAKKERKSHPDEIETEHQGYLISQDTFYAGYLKGVGRIYQMELSLFIIKFEPLYF